MAQLGMHMLLSKLTWLSTLQELMLNKNKLNMLPVLVYALHQLLSAASNSLQTLLGAAVPPAEPQPGSAPAAFAPRGAARSAGSGRGRGRHAGAPAPLRHRSPPAPPTSALPRELPVRPSSCSLRACSRRACRARAQRLQLLRASVVLLPLGAQLLRWDVQHRRRAADELELDD